MKTWKYLFVIHELWKYENISLQYTNSENKMLFKQTICLKYTNYENICLQTWILKIGKCQFETNYEM